MPTLVDFADASDRGVGGLVLKGTISNAAADSYIILTGLPRKCTLSLLKQDLLTGTGTTVRGTLRVDAGASASAQPGMLARVASPDANISEAGPITLFLPSGALFFYPEPDAGTDNTVAFEIHIQPGH